MEWRGNANGGGKLPSFERSKKFGGPLLAPAPRFMEQQEFSLQEGRGAQPWKFSGAQRDDMIKPR